MFSNFFSSKGSLAFPKLGIREHSVDRYYSNENVIFFTTSEASNKTCLPIETFLTYYLF